MMKRIISTIFCGLLGYAASAQVTIVVPVATDTVVCNGAPLTLQAVKNGYVPHLATFPYSTDDGYSPLYPIGFTFNFYGTNYTNFVISTNGYITFTSSSASSYSAYSIAVGVPGNANCANAVLGSYSDLLITTGTATVNYGVAGVAPNRKLVVDFCNCPHFSCTSLRTNMQIILYEGSNIAEVHIQHKDACASWNSGYAIEGVEKTGAAVGTAAPGRNYPSVWTVTTPDARRFTPDLTLTSYACTTIPYSPIPDSNAIINWYNGTTFLGTGPSVVVNPTVPTTYQAYAVTCKDTSRDFVNVTIGAGPVVSSITKTNPTVCGFCNGTITLHGLVPGSSDTIKYYYNSVLQPTVVAVPDAAGNVTLTGLCAGTYTNLTIKVGYCTSIPYGPTILTDPAFVVSSTASTNPSICGLCNGTITLYGLTPGTSDTINYIKDGVPQSPIILIPTAAGAVTLTGLCAGVYSGITVKMNYCVTPAVGPITISNPAFTISGITSVNPTVCGICDGSITISGLVPGYYDTINYIKDGIPQPTVVMLIPASGSITLTNLCAGAYTGITVKMNTCTANGTNVTLTNPAFTISSTSFVNPTVCGICDGSITINGLIAGYYDTVSFTKDGIPQPPVVLLVPASGTIVLTNLCAGVYSGISVKMNSCIANTGNITLTNPSFTISSTNNTNPSVCGACDATITIYGLIPGYIDTVYYIKDGVPATPVILTVPASGTIILTGLCAGVYTNIRVKMNSCITPSVGPITLVNPAFGIADTASTNASCSACDGTITLFGLTPGQTIIVNYSFNGTPQSPLTFTSTAAGTVTLTNLCPGSYSNITAKLNTCVSNPVGTVVISAPPLIPIYVQSYTQPTECGLCNGTITIKGAPPGPIDTIFYNLNGVPQTPFIYSASSDSIIVLYNLCEGDYSNFFIKVGPCPTTTIPGTTTLTAPTISAGFTSAIHLGCVSDTVFFTNTSTSTGTPGTLWYLWDFGDGITDTSANPMHIYNSQGTYVVTLTTTNHHCVRTASTTIVLDHPIQAVFTSPSLVCQKNPVAFTNASIGTPPTYVWDFGDGTQSTATNPSHTYNYIGTYTVQLIATNLVPCSDTVTHTIFVDSLSPISMTLSDTVLCQSTYITLTSNYSHVGNTGSVWHFGNGDSILNVNPVIYAYPAPGTFTITSSVSFRICPTISTSRIVTVLPQPQINLGPDTTVCEGSDAIILFDAINAGNPLASWIWNTGATGYQISATTHGGYEATVTIGNCHASDSVYISQDCFMSMPNVFTPNGDGINDYFYPRQFLSSGLIEFKMQIYNRWGQLLFETNSVDGKGWDGRFNGERQPEGVYVYIIDGKFKDGKKEHHQGNITLIK